MKEIRIFLLFINYFTFLALYSIFSNDFNTNRNKQIIMLLTVITLSWIFNYLNFFYKKVGMLLIDKFGFVIRMILEILLICFIFGLLSISFATQIKKEIKMFHLLISFILFLTIDSCADLFTICFCKILPQSINIFKIRGFY